MAFAPSPGDHTTTELRDARVAAASNYASTDAPDSWPPSYADPFPGATLELVETPAAALTADLLGGAVAHHGCLIVRDLLDTASVAKARTGLDAARDEQTRFHNGSATSNGWYEPLQTGSRMDAVMRKSNADQGVVWLADSPNATASILQLLGEANVPSILAQHFGEPPMFSLQKSTLRTVLPEERLTTWHQDGAFMGTDVRTMNLWIALSDCGGSTPASGMEMIPGRVDEILDTTEGIVKYAVPFDTVDEIAAKTGVVNPEFRAGDAVFFDERFLHRTALGPGLTETRYALECWFFAPASFAERYTSLLV